MTRKTSKEEVLDNGYHKFTETVETLTTISTRTVYASPWEVTVTACFCCTCGEDDFGMVRSDWACRNHNMGFGMRPCDIHNQPGQETDDEVIEGKPEAPKMPMAVSVYREAVKNGQPTY